VQKEEKGRMGGGRMGGKAPPPPKLDKAEEDSKAFSKELARWQINHYLELGSTCVVDPVEINFFK
jgi:hypothetical protein